MFDIMLFVRKACKGVVYIKTLEEKYSSIINLQKLIEKNPENLNYPVELNEWLYYLEHQDETVRTHEAIRLKNIIGQN